MLEGTLFNPARIQRPASPALRKRAKGGDTRDGSVYVYFDERIPLAINAAIATYRPLLLSGPSGCGKSTLAKNVALSLGWRYYEFVVTSRTEARDFLYRFDSIRRLNDAQAQKQGELKPPELYIEPSVLWWAFDRKSAQQRGSQVALQPKELAVDPCEMNQSAQAVVLIDEIDKAEVDVPNALLVPLGSLQFKVEQTGAEITTDKPPLIIITTNGERELPLAFMRRCLSLSLKPPDQQRLVEIARAKISKKKKDEELFNKVAEYVLAMGKDGEQNIQLRPSTAEYLDTVRACIDLKIAPDDPVFAELANITISKRQDIEGVD